MVPVEQYMIYSNLEVSWQIRYELDDKQIKRGKSVVLIISSYLPFNATCRTKSS